MESIPENPLLKFNSDTMISIRKLYNLDKPGEMDKAIDLLDDWIKKQNHFTKKNYSREYLERIIVYLKGSVERSKNQIDKLCTLRTLLPVYFEKSDPKNEFQDLKKYYVSAILPKLTKDHYRVFNARFMSTDVNSKIFLKTFQMTTIINEYLKANDYCNGLICILDYRDINLIEFLPRVNMLELNQFITICMILLNVGNANIETVVPTSRRSSTKIKHNFQQGYAMRVKSIHVLTPSKDVDMLVKILSKMFGPKVGKRINVHAKYDALCDHVPRDILPVDYGGYEKSLMDLNDDWMECLSQKENIEYTKELREAVTNEAYRQTDKFNEMYMGMAGTFRTLNID